MKGIAAIVTVAMGSSLLAAPQDVLRFQPQRETSGCPTGNVSAPVRALEADDFVELERTGCYGLCPAYKVRIYADGRIHWQGNRDVFSTGAVMSSVTPETARVLLEKYRANNFWSLCQSYSANITDGPTYFTTVRIGDPEKRVSNYSNVAPTWVGDLENEVDELAGTYEWINGRLQTQLFAYLPDPNRGPSPPRVALVQISQAANSVRPGTTPLMIAAGRGEVSEVERLLAEKADPNAIDRSGWTPLMYAAGGRAPAETIRKILSDEIPPH